MSSITAEPEEIRAAGRKMVSNAEKYLGAVKNIYHAIDGLTAHWQGADNQAFAKKVYEHKPNIDALGKVLGNYGVFFQETGNSLERIQGEIAQQATMI